MLRIMDKASSDFFNRLPQYAQKELTERLFSSVVGISGTVVLKDENKNGRTLEERFGIKTFYHSAFVVLLEQACCFFVVTAGHVLKLIQSYESDEHRILRMSLHDRGPVSDDGFGVPIRKECMIVVSPYERKGDNDCGGFTLPRFESITIFAGQGVKCISDELVADPDETFDAYFLLGFPEKAQVSKKTETSPESLRMIFDHACCMLPLTPMEDESTGGRRRFTARIDHPDDPRIASIVGMSGGPVWGVRIDEDSFVIRLVGIQSEWYESKKIILAEYAKPFLDACTKDLIAAFEKVLGEQINSESVSIE